MDIKKYFKNEEESRIDIEEDSITINADYLKINGESIVEEGSITIDDKSDIGEFIIDAINNNAIKVKYFNDSEKLVINPKGNCIDVYANKDFFIPFMGYAMIPLGFALELPKGMTGRLLPRSSTFKTWGCIETNSVGFIDDTYIGDEDQWHMPVQCTMAQCTEKVIVEGSKVTCMGTWIRKGDKIAQFELHEAMEMPVLKEVESFGNESRGGFGTTGKTKGFGNASINNKE